MAEISEFAINGRQIGAKYPPYVIAELSANHNGRLETALEIIDAAANAGADAVKLQTYRPDTITLDLDTPDFRIHGGLWDGRRLYDLYEEAHMPWEWHKPLFDHAAKRGITIFSSPFDDTAVDLLEDLNAPAYKIASFEAVDLPLIAYAAQTKKPLIISTGLTDVEEIEEAITCARDNGCEQLAILHCVSGYPAPPQDYNLATISDMARRFGVVTGLSDHTLGNATAVASTVLGASIIEKHFTLRRSDGGPDSAFSLEPEELRSLCDDAKTAFQALGTVNYATKESEKANEKFRRSLYFVSDIKANSQISEKDIKSVRPGYGLAPKFKGELVGRYVKNDIKTGTPTSWELLK